MKIKRTVNGQELEFELTTQERWEAYYEQEMIFDAGDCADVIYGMSDEECFDAYKITVEEFRKLLPYMGQEMQRLLDMCGIEWTYARDDAIREIIGEYLEGKLQ